MNEPTPSVIPHVTSGQWARSVFIGLLPIVAILLGGSTRKSAEGFVVALLGAFLIVQPPRRSLGWIVNLLLLAAAACVLAVFLQATMLPVPEWRTRLADGGIIMPNAITPQPWVTLGCVISLLAGLCWLYRVSAQQLELRAARFQMRLFASGGIFIAVIAVLFHLLDRSFPLWHSDFGPFANRDQTALVFAVVALIALAAGQDDIRFGRPGWILWLFGFALILTALWLADSPAGQIVFLTGSGLWILLVAIRLGSIRRHWLARTVAGVLGLTLLICGAVLFFRSGFWQEPAKIHWHAALSEPVFGIGLGNFEPLTPLLSVAHNSDWCWAIAEMGFITLVIMLAAAVMLVRHAFPLEPGSNQRFRLAALIAAIMLLLQGFGGTALHSPAFAYSALFLLGLSLHRPASPHLSRSIPWIFRALGLILMMSGIAWAFAAQTMALLPGAVGVASAKHLANVAARGRNYRESIELTTRALEWAPLDGELYVIRANAEIARRSSPEAIADFRRARLLGAAKTNP